MRPLSTDAKIAELQGRIDRSLDRIKAEQEKVDKWRSEIEKLKTFEIKALLDEIDLPYDELKAFLEKLKSEPAGSGDSAPSEQI